MTQLNNKYYLVVKIDADSFSLTDLNGVAINTSGFTAYVSGGIAERVYEIVTPYREADLETLQVSQNADTMYIVHNNYEPRTLTRSSDINWLLSRYVRTADPFTTAKTITGITGANPGVVTATGHGFSTGDLVYIDSVVGMTQVNNTHFKITVLGANTFSLQTPGGVNVNTSGYTAYSSAGKAEIIEGRAYPRAVTFTDDARLAMAGTRNNPETLYFSKEPTAAGAVQFNDFTTGTGASDALIFTLAPLNGKVDAIRWLTNTDKFIVVGTFGSVRRMYGAAEAEPLTPTAVTAKTANSDGCSETSPVIAGPVTLYIQRGGLALQSLQYDYLINGYTPIDETLVANHLTTSGLKQLVRQVGKPVIIWAVRNDGVLLGLTYNVKENIAGWHRHTFRGGQVKWAGIMPRENNQEQLWLIVQRTINDRTVRFVEYIADIPNYPDFADYYSGESRAAEDLDTYLSVQFETVKTAIHLDACATYDGSAYGLNAGATMPIPDAANVNGTTGVIFTATAAVFTSDMVGRQIWGRYLSDGSGGGRATITAFTSSTSVTCTIIDPFPSGGSFDPGDWFITATTVSGLDYLENTIVGVTADGGCPPDETVLNGAITITEPSSVINVGIRYTGVIQSLPLDQGGVSGPAQSKPKIVAKTAFRFINGAGIKFGTSPYQLTELTFRRVTDITGRPIPLSNGVADLFYEDTWDTDKGMVIVQENPLPCTIASIDIYMETTDE